MHGGSSNHLIVVHFQQFLNDPKFHLCLENNQAGEELFPFQLCSSSGEDMHFHGLRHERKIFPFQ